MPLLLTGIGDGARMVAALEQSTVDVVAWEADHGLWHDVLDRIPLRPWLESGRLKLLLGPDRLHAPALSEAVEDVHPDLARYLGWTRTLCDAHRPVLLAMAGELFVDDTGAAFESHGWRRYQWDRAHLPAIENAHILSTSGAALLWRINTAADVCEEASEVGIPAAIWEIDPTLDGPARLGDPLPTSTVFTYRKANVSAHVQAGYGKSHYLPLATAPGHMGAVRDAPELHADIAFVGSSMVESARTLMDRLWTVLPPSPAVRARVQQVMQLQSQRLDRWMVPALMDRLLPGVRARVQAAHGGLDPALLIGEQIAALRRLNVLAPLVPLGLKVWGDAGWSLLHDKGADWRGPADHFRDIPTIYRHAKINVDIGRIYQQDIVTMRVFDVLGAGGFLLAEHSDALTELFTIGEELDTWRTTEELVHKAKLYLQNPALRVRIAAAGHTRVLRDHTIAARVEQILQTLGLAHPTPRPIP